MGWAAVQNDVTIEACVLFAILFCWQMPHFFSLAWMYRKDYARAGFKILTVSDEHATRTTRQILFYCIALIPASLAPAFFGMTGTFSLVAALLFGAGFLVYGSLLSHASRRTDADALGKITVCSRRMFFASLIYLPALMIVMSFDKL